MEGRDAGGRPSANAEQAAYWNSPSGLKWVENEAALNELMAGVLDRLLELALPRAGEAVLDVGCGTGASTLAAAAAVMPGGRVTGADISELQITRARTRMAEAGLANVDLMVADVQTHGFAPGSYDLVVSRFGMMFFADPGAAFATLARALRSGGRLVFATWAPVDVNPWFAVPRRAAVARLGGVPPDPPGAPGPFGLADVERGLGFLRKAGLVDCHARTETVALSPGSGLAGAAALATTVGPAVRILAEKEGTTEDAAAIAAAVAEGFAPYAAGVSVQIPASINFFEAVCAGGS